MVAERVEPERLIFVEERWPRTPHYLRFMAAPRREKGPTARWRVSVARTPLSASSSMSVEGMGPSLAVEGATTALVFEAYLERVLAPTLRKGQVVVLDNLSLPTKESGF